MAAVLQAAIGEHELYYSVGIIDCNYAFDRFY